MGVVYRAADESGRNEVALKVMASDLDGDPETRERFFREATVAGKLRHPNIVAVKDSGEDNGRLYIAMELLIGATLNELLKQPDALDLEDRLDMMIQVCQGLTVAHEAGVFHRDLKPANLFVCEDRRVKILDFGVARLVGSNMTVTGNIIGTPDFMSPEQVRGEEIDARSDIFSAGSVFYLLLTGRKPFAASDLPAVLNKVARAQPLPIRDTEAPDHIAAIVRKALAKDPAARHQEMSELACELMAAVMVLEKSTRRVSTSVRKISSDVMHLNKRTRELSDALELPEGAPDSWAAVCDQYPLLRNGIEALVTFPARSRVMRELHDVLSTQRESLNARVTQLEEAQTKAAAAKALHDSGAHEQALKEYDVARRIVPSSRVVARGVDACAEAVRKARERDAQLQARLTMATQAAERADWDGVLAIARDLEAIDPGNPMVARLRNDAIRNRDAERARQARPGSGKKAAASSAPPKSSGKHVAAAAAASGSHAADAGAEHESPPRTERTARAAHLRQEAVRHLTSGDLASAERFASEAVALHGTDKEARHLLESVRAAIALRAQQEENALRVADLLAQADELAAAHQFDQAFALCDEALAIAPTHVDGIATRARIAEQHAAYEESLTTDLAQKRRIQSATPALTQARRALEEGDFERARWCAENALALAPDWTDAQTLLATITASAPVSSEDDTVKLGDPDSDETAELAPIVHDETRHESSGWMRRGRTPSTETKG
jgi:serine/threonine protein kinase